MRIGFVGLLAAHSASAAVLESLREIPEGWHYVGRPSNDHKMHLRIAMKNPRPEVFEKTLLDVSTPGHPRYGRHLKRRELKEMLRPTPEATEAVMTWLSGAGINSAEIVDKGEWVNVKLNIETAEKLLDTEFGLFSNRYKREERKIRTQAYSVPDHLQEHIDMIQPTTRFGQPRPQGSHIFDIHYGASGNASNTKHVASCSTGVTPACLKKVYHLPDSIDIKNDTAGFAAFNNFLDQYPRYDDLSSFEEQYASYAKNQNFTWSSINGGKLNQNSSKDSTEADLDAQYLLSTAYPVPIHAYSTGGRGPIDPDLDQPDASDANNEPYLDFLNYMMDQPDNELPHTLSTSYGEDEQSSPLSYRTNVCNMLGQLGARGVTIIFSSGDTGVGSACQTNDGKNTTRFLPTFPAACPYVLAVGGTTGTSPESAASFSSGGFSDTWARPSWQEDAVTGYYKILGSKWEGYYNTTGRGFPDVAALGDQYAVISQGQTASVQGTSCSAPVFAGVVALLNAQRIQAGKSPLGFINPFIYSSGFKGLTDITSGGSSGCTGIDNYSNKPTPIVPGASWEAVAGWDPVTGHGTPDWTKLQPLAMAV